MTDDVHPPARGRLRAALGWTRRRWRRLACAAVVGGPLAAVGAFLLLDGIFPYPLERLAIERPSPQVTARDGTPLLETVAVDEQWRIPVGLASVAPHVIEATIAVEDERFRRHHGVDPLSIVRAVGQNISAGEVVSGASTITMQLCRLVEPRPRTFRSKLIEAFRAVQVERALTKDEILEAYLNHAPYGGNVVGIEAAARAWCGKGADELSLAEAALLAGLPQGPSILRPDRYPDRARLRRATVLARMHAEGFIDAETARRAAAEPIVVPDVDRTVRAPHAAWLALSRDPTGGRTAIDLSVQAVLARAVEGALDLPDGVQVAVVAIEIESGAVRGLVGSRDHSAPFEGQVNGATARRSPGSALKPFIYATAFARGRLAPEDPLPDVPIERGGWRPRNFDGEFRGSVSASVALRDSLNVPAILVTERLGLVEVLGVIERCGIPLPTAAAQRGGLACATGALEVTLLDLTDGYATLGRGGRALPATLREAEARLRLTEGSAGTEVLPRSACREIDAILGRRTGGLDSPWFVAKTGTSSRRRDAWAVGHNGRFAIGVWVGRFSGAGDPWLEGARAAMPILEGLFEDPTLASAVASPAPPPRVARRPFVFAEGDERPLRIVGPTEGEERLASDGTVTVRPRAEGGRPPYTWLLDGRALDAPRAVVPTGEHELRCVDAEGAAAIVRFSVVGPPRSR